MNSFLLESILKKVKNYLEEFPLLDDRYRLLFTLGEGRFGKVKLGYDLRANEFVAIKILKKSAFFLSFSQFYQEVKILLMLRQEKTINPIKSYNFKGILVKKQKKFKVMYHTSKFSF